jgi:hypothetical protein
MFARLQKRKVKAVFGLKKQKMNLPARGYK